MQPVKKILIPIPDKDFDTTEVALAWEIFKKNHFQIVFATEHGKVGETDPLLLSGVIFGQLGAKKNAIAAYHEMQKSGEFLNPITYFHIKPQEFDLLYLPGGHAKGMRQYLESKVLQDRIVEFFKLNKLIGSVCHGSLVMARIWFANWLVIAPSMLQCPELCTLGAISLAINKLFLTKKYVLLF